MGAVLVGALVLAIILIGGSFLVFGIKHFMLKKSGKYGLLFLRNKSGNIGLPRFVSLEEESATIKTKYGEKTFPFTPEEFMQGRFFGLPYAIKDWDDANVSYGLLCPKVNEKLQTEFQKVNIEGNSYLTSIPVYHSAKNPGVVDPELHKAVVAKEKLIVGIRDMFTKQNLITILVVVSIIIGLVACYLGYENFVMLEQTVIPLLNQIKSQVGTTIIQGV